MLAQGFQHGCVLRVEDVGRGARALLQDLVAERGLVAGAHFDLDPGLPFERRHEQRGRLFVLAVVERERRVPREEPQALSASPRGRQQRGEEW